MSRRRAEWEQAARAPRSTPDEGPHAEPDGRSAAPVLRFEHVSVAHHGSAPTLADVSFQVFPGEAVAVVGRSGSGKSTLALAAMGLLPESARVTGGAITVDGADLTRARERTWAVVRGATIGLVPQDPAEALNPLMTVGDQIEEALPPRTRDAEGRVAELLAAVGLADPARIAGAYPHELSGGMNQRALVAAALAGQPALVIADEPTSALDGEAAERVLDLLQSQVRGGGRALIVITHDLALVESRADRVLVIDDGRIVEQGPTATVMASPEHGITRDLIAAAQPAATSRSVAPSPRPAPLLSLRDIHRTFPARRGRPAAEVLDGVSFDLHAGECVGVVGPSGVGKSTLANIILGLDRATSGKVILDGINVHSRRGRKKNLALRRRIQPVFQNSTALNPRMTVGDTVAEPLKLHRVGDARYRRARVAELLDDVELAVSFIDRRPFELSGGQRQRVAIARALALEPDVLVLDEPFHALDSIAQARLLDLLSALRADRGLASILISHDRRVVDAIAETVVVLSSARANRP